MIENNQNNGHEKWKQLARLSSVGIMLVLCTLLGLGLGWYIDKWLVWSKPWFTLVFLLFGIAAGLLEVIRITRVR